MTEEKAGCAGLLRPEAGEIPRVSLRFQFDCLPPMPVPATAFAQADWMRGLGYRCTGAYLVDPSKIQIGYTRSEPLTWDELSAAMDRLTDPAGHWEPHPLILPGWFPHPLRELAEQWAQEHGWAGVVYDG